MYAMGKQIFPLAKDDDDDDDDDGFEASECSLIHND
jgi:hypothetical protein